MASRLVPDGNFFKIGQNGSRKFAANSKWCHLLVSDAGSASLLMLAINCITAGYTSKQKPNSHELVGELEGHMLCCFLYCNESTSVLSNEPLQGV
eukprot:5795933-Ditylum_brightwellii.AAC.1